MMGIAKKLLQLVRTTGQLDARGRKSGTGNTKPPAAAAAAPLPPLGERRTERRLAGPKPEKPSKPKYATKHANCNIYMIFLGLDLVACQVKIGLDNWRQIEFLEEAPENSANKLCL